MESKEHHTLSRAECEWVKCDTRNEKKCACVRPVRYCLYNISAIVAAAQGRRELGRTHRRICAAMGTTIPLVTRSASDHNFFVCCMFRFFLGAVCFSRRTSSCGNSLFAALPWCSGWWRTSSSISRVSPLFCSCAWNSNFHHASIGHFSWTECDIHSSFSWALGYCFVVLHVCVLFFFLGRPSSPGTVLPLGPHVLRTEEKRKQTRNKKHKGKVCSSEKVKIASRGRSTEHSRSGPQLVGPVIDTTVSSHFVLNACTLSFSNFTYHRSWNAHRSSMQSDVMWKISHVRRLLQWRLFSWSPPQKFFRHLEGTLECAQVSHNLDGLNLVDQCRGLHQSAGSWGHLAPHTHSPKSESVEIQPWFKFNPFLFLSFFKFYTNYFWNRRLWGTTDKW